jgi:hypothetical protein
MIKGWDIIFSPEILEKCGYWHSLHPLDGWEKRWHQGKEIWISGLSKTGA